MTGIARRTIDELAARYELEPELNDVFVEGVFDRDVLALVSDAEDGGRAIYEIETVEIPSDLLAAHGLTEGNKQRVIALARELAKIEGECSYVCFVDKDLDHWLGDLELTKRLRWSKYCAIELHFFSATFLRQLLVVTCKAKISNFDKFFEFITSALSDLYALRLADSRLSLGLRWIPFEPCLTYQKDVVSVSMATYVDRLLQASGRSKQKTKFLMEFSQCRDNFSGDCRNHIRGHDFMDMLVWSIRQSRGLHQFASTVAIQRLFILSACLIPMIVEDIQCTI